MDRDVFWPKGWASVSDMVFTAPRTLLRCLLQTATVLNLSPRMRDRFRTSGGAALRPPRPRRAAGASCNTGGTRNGRHHCRDARDDPWQCRAAPGLRGHTPPNRRGPRSALWCTERGCPSTRTLSLRFLELPGIQSAMGRQAQIDAVVAEQLPRRLWRGTAREIRRCADDRHAQVRPDPHGDHVLGHLLAETHPGVITRGNDVGQSLFNDNLDLDLRICPQEFRQLRPEHRLGGILSGRDANRARGLRRGLTP